ncbi:MAG TPA: hypothetical protein VGB77_21050, partial [Abditibacteriaceae bacterium]|jgi:hypothetical protein
LRNDLNLNLSKVRGYPLNMVRNFVVWWYANYDKLLRQNEFEEHFALFAQTYPTVLKNRPAWMDKLRR